MLGKNDQKWLFRNTVKKNSYFEPVCTHREKGLDDVSLDRAEGFVSDQNEDLLLFLQTDEVPKPGPLSQSANGQIKKNNTKTD